jgi:hypothetical protein
VPPEYQSAVADVDYVAFESRLEHRNPQRGRVNRVYVQVHNRGIHAAAQVTVKVHAADASAGLPPLPADFWTAFPADSTDLSHWQPIGPARTVPVSATEPAVVEWDWTTPTAAADHSCLLVVLDSADDSIPAAAKVLDVGALVANERRVGLKNLHVVNAIPGAGRWAPFRFCGDAGKLHTVRWLPSAVTGWTVGLVLQKAAQKKLKVNGFKQKKLTRAQLQALQERLGDQAVKFDTGGVYVLTSPARGGVLEHLKLLKDGLRAALWLAPAANAGAPGRLTVVQEAAGSVVGGSTFVLRAVPGPG